MELLRRDMKADRQRCLNGNEQAIAGNIEGVLVGQECFTREGTECLKPAQ